jgi:hypothetical protein
MQRLRITDMHATALSEQHSKQHVVHLVTAVPRNLGMASHLLALQEIEVADAADAAAHKAASEDIRKYRVTQLTPVLIVCEWLP